MRDSDYYKSGQHVKNANAAREKALVSIQHKRVNRIAAYYETPTLCANCAGPIKYETKNNKFCCKSCAAQFNNKVRIDSGWQRTEESKKKTGNAVSIAYSLLTTEEKEKRQKYLRLNSPQKQSDVEFTCKICGTTKIVPYSLRDRKTCGDKDCIVQAKVGVRAYINGRRKIIWFFNPNENKDVLLESSWEVEVANLLIKKNIEWIRPKFIKWVDNKGTTRRYFPDFYLPKFNVYLDPKNLWGMANSKDKMDKIAKHVSIVYGDLQLVIDYISGLK